MEKEKHNLKNVRLLIAVEEGDLQNVEKLLADQGADVNYVDSEHNSVLHYAVKRGDSDIVKLLLCKGADASQENDEVKSALDIAEELPACKEIIVGLQKNIMDHAFLILEKFADNLAEDFQAFEPKFRDIESGTNFISGNETEVMKEIRSQETKIKSCLCHLKSLNKISDSNTTRLTYKHVNVLMYILEAFATKETPGIKGEMENYYRDLAPGFNSDIKVFNIIRNLLCFCTHRKLSILDIGSLLGLNNDIKQFFKQLEGYLLYVCNTIDGKKVKKVEIKKILPELKKEDCPAIGSPDDDVLKEFVKLIAATYGPEDWPEKQIQELMFSFIVNLSPAFGKDVKEMFNVRSKIMQEFHKYDNIEDAAKSEFVKLVVGIRSDLFKYYYAKEIHDILHTVKPKDDFKEIDKILTGAMENFEEYFKVNFRGENKYQTALKVDTANSFEYECLETSESRHMEDAAIKELVTQYLKFMIIFDNEKVEEEYIFLQQKTDETNELVTTGRLKNVTAFQRREIFDKFLNLERLYTNLPSQYTIEKLKFKNELAASYSICVDTFDEVCRKYIENDEDSQDENNSERKIIDTIFILHHLQSLYHFSDRDVIRFYSRVVEEKGLLNLEEILDSIKNIKIPETKKELFQKEVDCLYNSEFIFFELNGRKAKVSSVKIIENILKIIHNTFYSYSVKFNNIPKAFIDEAFLNYLVGFEKMFRNRKSIGKTNFGYYVFMIFKKLINIDYAAPYIARMVIEFDDAINAIEKEDLVKLTNILLDDDSYVNHVDKLLKISCRNIDLYEVLWEKLSGRDLESLRPIFMEPIHVKRIYGHLIQSLSEHPERIDQKVRKLKKEMTKLLNNIVYNFYLDGSLDKALELLNIYLEEDSGTLTQLDFLEGKRLMAKIKNRKGQWLLKQENTSRSEAFEEHKSALKILWEIESSLVNSSNLSLEHNITYLLTLGHVAYTHHLLEDYANSLKGYGQLYFAIKRYSLRLPYKTSSENTVDNFENISNIIKLNCYKDLVAYSHETEEYLNVLKIRMCMAFECSFQASEHDKLYQSDKALQLNEYVLKVYKEVNCTLKEIDQPQDSALMCKLAVTYGYVSRLLASLDHRKNKEQIVNCRIQSARFYIQGYRIESEKLRDHPNAIKILFYLFKVMYILGEDKLEGLQQNIKEATKARVNSLLIGLMSYQNLVGEMINKSKYKKQFKI